MNYHGKKQVKDDSDSDEEDEESDRNTNPANPKIKMAFNKKR